MAEVRIRCQVLQALAIHAPCTSREIEQYLPKLTAAQIQKACYKLLGSDEIKKTGTQPRIDGTGRPFAIYEVIDGKSKPKRASPKRNRKSYKELVRVPMRFDAAKQRIIVKHRDRKIRLLERYLKNCDGDTDRDLLHGMINDYRSGF